MTIELRKATAIPLRQLGLNESWLQARIIDDPSLLGLGELEIAAREHHQPLGGRIDFLMRDNEEEIYYEVEVMLGALDESHIIRTIEYWDIERQRRPQWDHRAVIVAEQITARFFNVLRLLNRAVPLIAVKLSAFQIDDRVVLHPITVLDVLEEISDPETVDPVERVDRPYWEKKSAPLLGAMDKVVGSLNSANIHLRLTYNRHHIALGTSGRNFCWFYPRKIASAARIEFRVTNEIRDDLISFLQENQIDAAARHSEWIAFNISAADLEKHIEAIQLALLKAELLSH